MQYKESLLQFTYSYLLSKSHTSTAAGNERQTRLATATSSRHNLRPILVAGTVLLTVAAISMLAAKAHGGCGVEVKRHLALVAIGQPHTPAALSQQIQGPPKKFIHTLTKENSNLYNRLF